MCRDEARHYAASGRASRGLAEPTQQAWPGGMVPEGKLTSGLPWRRLPTALR